MKPRGDRAESLAGCLLQEAANQAEQGAGPDTEEG